ncbi:MAG: hypothetical protein JNM62_11690 [Flavobacteriales bacterium]|nr:hypothetical protein [Flavobacteriales bacterium]
MSIRSSLYFSLFAAGALVACNKDELTVVNTATTPTCSKVVVELDIDSLQQCAPGPWGTADVHLSLCSCDTLSLVPVNVPPPLFFNRWVIDQGPENAYYFQPVLDTITASTELWLDFDGGTPQTDHFRIDVDVVNCK